MDLVKELSSKILVERIGFAFFVEIEYVKALIFVFIVFVLNTYANCQGKETQIENNTEKVGPKFTKVTKEVYVLVEGKINGEDNDTDALLKKKQHYDLGG